MTTAPDTASERRTVRESVPPVREWARTFVIGIFMGTADGVPGVSGGTIALIAGIYERLIGAINAVTPTRIVDFLRALTPLDGGISIDRALAEWEAADGWFVVALLMGVGTAVIIVTQAVEYVDEHEPVVLFGFFFGLIAASAVILGREIDVQRADTALAASVGFLLAFVVSGQGEMLSGGGLAVVFFAGAVAVSAMILPGISGSLLLVILSQYTRMTEALSNFLHGLLGFVTGESTAAVTGPAGREVVVFIAGGLVGLFTISRLIKRALAANREVTYAFLVALVVGALRAPIATLDARPEVTWTTADIGEFAALAVIGAVVVLVLDWYAVDLDLDAA